MQHYEIKRHSIYKVARKQPCINTPTHLQTHALRMVHLTYVNSQEVFVHTIKAQHPNNFVPHLYIHGERGAVLGIGAEGLQHAGVVILRFVAETQGHVVPVAVHVP